MTQPPPPPAGTPVEVQAATIGAHAVVVAAVIAIVATVLGALVGVVGGQASAAATNRQTDQQSQSTNATLQSEADRDAKTFIRQQLQAAAAKLIDDSKSANRQEVDLVNLFLSPTFDGRDWDHVKKQNDLTLQLDVVSADTAKLQLLGYKASDSTAAEVLIYHEGIVGDLTRGALSGKCLMPNTPAFNEALDQANNDMEAYDATQGALISAVQSDFRLSAA
jgi:hypothetical protein